MSQGQFTARDVRLVEAAADMARDCERRGARLVVDSDSPDIVAEYEALVRKLASTLDADYELL